MKNIHVLVIEDEQVNIDFLTSELEKANCKVSTADNLQDALGIYYATTPDIVLIDIYLHGEKEGIVFAEKISQHKETCKPFIFLTSATDRNTFEAARLTQPYSYLLKPFNPLELMYAIELALEKDSESEGTLEQGNAVSGESCFFVKKRNEIYKVEIQDIEYVKVEDRYCELCLINEQFLTHTSLKEMLTKLPSNFIRIHRNYVVNMNHVKSISAQDATVYLKSGKDLLISRRYLEAIRKQYEIMT